MRALLIVVLFTLKSGLVLADDQLRWAERDSQWCLSSPEHAACLPRGSRVSTIAFNEVEFDYVADSRPPVVLSFTSDTGFESMEQSIYESGGFLLRSFSEQTAEISIYSSADLYFGVVHILPGANLIAASLRKEQAEEVVSDFAKEWMTDESKPPTEVDPSRCKRYFHAGCE